MKSKFLFLSLIFFAVLSAYAFVRIFSPKTPINLPKEDFLIAENKSSVTPTLNLPVYSKPVKLLVPSLNIDSEIEYVGMDEKGRMDVPKLDQNVAWWSLGVVPGEVGNAVLAGHYDAKDGGPAVFYDLSKLKIGDVVTINDDKGNTIDFEVYKIEKFKDESFPIEMVFGPSKDVYLNLITCDGVFDQTTKNYSDRLVVFTKLIEK